MIVSGLTSLSHAEGRANYYRRRGYRVNVVTATSSRAGSAWFLSCTPQEGR
jgi:hypothetical protein